MRRFLRNIDGLFEWTCFATGHAGSCRIIRWWYGTALFRWMWYRP